MSDRPLVATYRLQLHGDFGFRDAADLLDHLVDLGVSHVYTSPVHDAVPGSTHGYNVVDHSVPNDELGGEDGFRHLVTAAHERGLGLVLDIVPNHMATHPHNSRWWDVLRFGRSSAYESWFDIDWEHGSEDTEDRLLLAVLGDHYGAIVRSGELVVDLDDDDVLILRYHDRVFPMSIASTVEVLRDAASQAGDQTFVGEVEELARRGESGADHSDALRRLASLSRFWQGEQRSRLLEVVAGWNADPERLHVLLEQQHYRLAHWSAGTESLDYRRFFDVSDLIGLQMHVDQVFESVHARTVEWVGKGDVDGIRIDHPDGLTDPTGYLETLRRHAPDAWIVVEKILAGDEELPKEWPVDGTTGYESLILLDRVFVDPSGEGVLDELLAEHAGIEDDFDTVRQTAKEDVVHQVLLAEMHRLTHDLLAHNQTLLDRVDVSDYDARTVIGAFLVEMPVYRTYVRDGAEADARDRAIIEGVRAAVLARDTFDAALVDLIADLLIGPLESDSAIRFRTRFQQSSGPVMAKGIEDTAFYRFPRLISQNEVGGEPSDFGVDLATFHARQQRAATHEPLRMIASSTHDTKRSEDVRARIAVLSEATDAWRNALDVFTARAAALGGDDRDPTLEYLMHQTIVGAHPLSAERAVEYLRKAAREAKRSTSWLQPNEEHEQHLFDAVTAWLGDDDYLAAVQALLDVIATPGRANALALKLLALTVPGIPDLYQGSELWTGDLVDPDNRRPVDYALRRQLVREMSQAAALDLDDAGTAKLRVIQTALAARRRHPEAFAPVTGTYEPLLADGPAADHVVAFVRGGSVATIVQRFGLRLEAEGGWRATRLDLPPGRWSDALTGRGFEGSAAVAEVLGLNPVALLERV